MCRPPGWPIGGSKGGDCCSRFASRLPAERSRSPPSPPLPADGQPWTVPNVHPAAGPTAVDLVELLVGPDLKWEGFAPGDYRAVRSATSDRGLALTLRGTLPAGGQPKRLPPSLRLRGAGAEYSTVETLDWRIEPDRALLTARIRATVARGPLARLVVRVPPGSDPTVVARLVAALEAKPC